ncbi:MAG: hypothetical protein U1E67_22510 [Hyphomicrobiales bacterium]
MTQSRSKPYNPYLVLAAAIILPGGGHVLNGVPHRGLVFLFFIIVLGWATSKLAPDHVSFIGRYAGGILIYGLSVLDAYKQARVKWELWRYKNNLPGASNAAE